MSTSHAGGTMSDGYIAFYARTRRTDIPYDLACLENCIGYRLHKRDQRWWTARFNQEIRGAELEGVADRFLRTTLREIHIRAAAWPDLEALYGHLIDCEEHGGDEEEWDDLADQALEAEERWKLERRPLFGAEEVEKRIAELYHWRKGQHLASCLHDLIAYRDHPARAALLTGGFGAYLSIPSGSIRPGGEILGVQLLSVIRSPRA